MQTKVTMYNFIFNLFLSLNPTEEDNRLFILILVASFIIISMIIIIGSTACILLCFEESIEEKEEELQEKLLKFTEVRTLSAFYNKFLNLKFEVLTLSKFRGLKLL